MSSNLSLCRLEGFRLALLISIVFHLPIVQNAQTTPLPDAEPKLIEAPEFVLSDKAAAAGIDGTLLLLVSLDSEGKVKSARVLAGPEWPCKGKKPKSEIEEVIKQAESSVLKAKFLPAVKNGKPSETEVGVNYRIGRAYKEMMQRREMESAEKASQPKRIEGGVLNGKATSLPKPEYPYSARSRRASGAVTVSVLIDETGRIVSAGAMNGSPWLQDAARDAACKAKFSPTTLKDEPVRVSGVITYNFVAP